MAELEDSPLQQQLRDRTASTESDYPIYVVVGTGPVGVRCAQRLLELSDEAQVVIFGAEAESPYNRVKLSQYLSDQLSLADLDNPVLGQNDGRLAEFIDRKIVAVDRNNKTVTDAAGNIQPYDKLILATGSTPAIPQIPGTDFPNVYPFRSLRNTEDLIRLRERSHHICVVGAGALGLEAAAALKTQNNRVTLQSRTRLLGGLLGDEAEGYLQSSLAALGVELSIGDAITAVEGDEVAREIHFASGKALQTDAIVLCTGIHPEITLAQQCGLDTARGIVVNKWLQTSDPDIYAVGECAEFGRDVYQFVRPGYEQAESCSEHICRRHNPGRQAKPYQGSYRDIQLKIAHIPCAVIGDVDDGEQYVYRNRFKGLYRQLTVRDGRLCGAVYIGSWDEASQLRQAVAAGEAATPRALKRFAQDGHLWQKSAARGIKEQPDHYLVCQCNGVSKGELCTAISQGKRNLMDLQQATTAGSVCGSCRPLIAELLDVPAPNLVMRHARGILITSFVSLLLIALAVLMPPAPISESVQSHWYWQKLWYDNFWKQVSGYSLLGFCLLTASLSLRKRWRKLTHGHVDHWRYVHSLIGCGALIVLVVHTGFRLGENLNLALMLVFLAATTTGALVGVFMARNHHWTDIKLREHRKWWSRVHYALLWTLPVLLAYHILAVYYF
ncbi:FAD-dependent oxidoreductase [Microbulbifer marinus]|uniref:Nitrite reductase (NADH) large subunit n=1 Tax=Microbulbifer marinus TaxID=658218 RepID=A0A1H3WY90_9GAMM|nr:FAD-dependent oxidoreductase [Microbulbifer marinus]SDZ92135.1 nitrite reductase (NADH) large subunit [Microbulbifer marinus]